MWMHDAGTAESEGGMDSVYKDLGSACATLAIERSGVSGESAGTRVGGGGEEWIDGDCLVTNVRKVWWAANGYLDEDLDVRGSVSSWYDRSRIVSWDDGPAGLERGRWVESDQERDVENAREVVEERSTEFGLRGEVAEFATGGACNRIEAEWVSVEKEHGVFDDLRYSSNHQCWSSQRKK